MQSPILEVVERDLAVKPADLRRKKHITAEFYGHNKKNLHLSVDHETFARLFRSAGKSTVIELKLPSGTSEQVLIHHVDRFPVSNNFMHVDFYGINVKEKITTKIPLEFIGESNAVRNLGGILVTNLDEIEVKCLPGDLVQHFEVDLTGLENVTDAIHVRDLKLPPQFEILEESDSMIVAVQMPATEAEEETPITAPSEVPATAQSSETDATTKEE